MTRLLRALLLAPGLIGMCSSLAVAQYGHPHPAGGIYTGTENSGYRHAYRVGCRALPGPGCCNFGYFGPFGYSAYSFSGVSWGGLNVGIGTVGPMTYAVPVYPVYPSGFGYVPQAPIIVPQPILLPQAPAAFAQQAPFDQPVIQEWLPNRPEAVPQMAPVVAAPRTEVPGAVQPASAEERRPAAAPRGKLLRIPSAVPRGKIVTEEARGSTNLSQSPATGPQLLAPEERVVVPATPAAPRIPEQGTPAVSEQPPVPSILPAVPPPVRLPEKKDSSGLGPPVPVLPATPAKKAELNSARREPIPHLDEPLVLRVPGLPSATETVPVESAQPELRVPVEAGPLLAQPVVTSPVPIRTEPVRRERARAVVTVFRGRQPVNYALPAERSAETPDRSGR